MIFNARTHTQAEILLNAAAQELSHADPKLGEIIGRVGPCRLGRGRRNNYFASLAEAIIYQQLAGKAAAAILGRFRKLYPSRRFPTPEEVLATPDERLRSAGISPQKLSYLKDLARRIQDGSLVLNSFSSKDDEEIVSHLTQVKGIGRWTSEMFLIFCLGRRDVLPLNDLGILKAVQRAYGFRRLPSARTLQRIGRRWQPHRSVACWYLWASIDGINIESAAKRRNGT